MTEDCEIRLDHTDGVYKIGEELHGTVRVGAATASAAKNLEFSILWYTEGKGDTDMEVIHFENLDLERGPEYPFEARLPLLPVSYTGHLLKIHWVARLRVDPRSGHDVLFDQPFTVIA